MKLQLDINIEKPEINIEHRDSILLIGSCFTGNIGKMLSERKFNCSYNPTGILFDAGSIARHINDIIYNKKYTTDDLFLLNDVYHSWNHHSEFSDINATSAVEKINTAIEIAHIYITQGKWMVITLGSAFYYHLSKMDIEVANCHRAPAQWFEKKMFASEEVQTLLTNSLKLLRRVNPQLKIIFTVSPVRHIRDGVIENNISKAQLIDAVHKVKSKFDDTYYFPSYEIVIDVLRDYRFYDIDLVHPNYLATEIIYEFFEQNYFTRETIELSKQIMRIARAANHRPMHPQTNSHRVFVEQTMAHINAMRQAHPYMNWDEETTKLNLQLAI